MDIATPFFFYNNVKLWKNRLKVYAIFQLHAKKQVINYNIFSKLWFCYSMAWTRGIWIIMDIRKISTIILDQRTVVNTVVDFLSFQIAKYKYLNQPQGVTEPLNHNRIPTQWLLTECTGICMYICMIFMRSSCHNTSNQTSDKLLAISCLLS